MTKLPWDKWFFEDLDGDCGHLSMAARGAWVWIIGKLRNYGGQKTMTLDGWARVARGSIGQTVVVLKELIDEEICDSNVTSNALSQNYNGKITITCRRLAREYKQKQQNNLRQTAHRERHSFKTKCNAKVTPIESESESDKEKREKKESRKKRGPLSHFVPDDFVLPEKEILWAKKERPDLDINLEEQAFRDHEFDKQRSDWIKTWRNWIRKARPPAKGSSRKDPEPDLYVGAERKLSDAFKPEEWDISQWIEYAKDNGTRGAIAFRDLKGLTWPEQEELEAALVRVEQDEAAEASGS